MNFYFKSYLNLSDQEKCEILNLRNAPYVRENMYHAEVINLSTHFQWIESLKNDTTCKYWAISLDDRLIGSIDLSRIDLENKFAEWGFYIDKNCRGIGALLEFLGMQHFFEKLNFQTILAGVYEGNQKVCHLHKNKFGYKEAHEYDQQCDLRKFYGLILTKDVWLSRKVSIYNLLTKIYTIDSIVWD